MSEDRPGLFARGCVVATAPLLVLFLPLLVHQSAHPAWGGFSRAYGMTLALVAAAGAVFVLLIGWACRRSRTLFPALTVVIVVIGVVVTCLAAELVLTYRLRREDAFAEYRAWGHKRSLLFAFEAEPNHRWTNADASYSTDRFGFRTHVRGPWDATARTRIFTVGESSVFGYGLNDDETWPHLLEEKLRARLGDPSLTVVNAGNNGFTSIQTLFRFYTKVVPQKPTHVIAYLGPNDIYGSGPDKLLITEDILFSGSVAEYWAAETEGKNLYERSLLFYGLQHWLPALAPRTRRAAAAAAPSAPVIYGQAQADEIAGRFIANVSTLCLIARANGIEPVVATFMHDLPAGVPFPPLEIRTANARLRTFAAEQHVALVDLEQALRAVPDKDSYFFADHYHPSRKGAELIATTIAETWR